MPLACELHIRIAAVCPIHGVSIGAEDDRATWTVSFDGAATDAQKSAAYGIIAAFESTEQIEPRLVPKRYIIDRLHTAGKLDAAMAALAAADTYTQQRWITRDSVYFNDPTCLAVLAAIGADPAVIMAP
ncbi:hypothetical protein [Rhodopseudomonas pseudopalustris]|uniref:Uncharacterized protein n=1 Tax=Rhodopseudomonas pseudopalustris TaxID=1513892 RepID=A0A1H8V833_9BRAD|nr:hypothetical protein [Rhodopseudomonas pseudopalustris]SEP11413.1 hypothetical protein SAMN05444123_108103 [Rhodopseudomonas pseudopalustris]